MLVLSAGCAAGWRHTGRVASPATSSASTRPAEHRSTDRDLERRADAYAHFAAGIAHDLRGEPRAAEEAFQASLESDPGNETLALELAQRHLRSREPARAAEILSRASRQPGASSHVFGWLGAAQLLLTNQTAAVQAYREAIRRAPDSILGYHGLAQIHLQNQRTNEAWQVLETAARRKEASPALLVDLAGFHIAASRQRLFAPEPAKARALELLDRAARLNPTDPAVLERLAEGYRSLGEVRRATTLYEALLRDHPPSNPAARLALRHELFRLYLRESDLPNAGRHLEGVLAEHPTNPQAHLLLGALCLEEKRYADAERHLEQAILLEPTLEPAYYDLAGVQLSLGRPELAADTIARARARFPVGFLTEFYTGLSLAAQGKYLEAVSHYETAELHARVSEPARLTDFFFFQLGAAQERAGRFAEAEQALRQCLELAPRHAEALNHLGYMWAERGVNLEEARTFIERALEIEPDNPAYLDSLAWVLYRQGNAAAALEPQLRAVALMPEPDATLYDHLGDIYAALGRLEEAREAWHKSYAIEPDPKVKQKLQPPASPSPP